MVRLVTVLVSVPEDMVATSVVGVELVPPYTLYDARSLSLLAVQTKLTWVLPGVAIKAVGAEGSVKSVTNTIAPSCYPHLRAPATG